MSVKSVYRHIINDVMEKMRPEFEAQGYDAAVVQLLRRLWERKLENLMDPSVNQYQMNSGMPMVPWQTTGEFSGQEEMMRQITESPQFGYALPPGPAVIPFTVPQQHYFQHNDLVEIAQQQRNLDMAVSQHTIPPPAPTLTFPAPQWTVPPTFSIPPSVFPPPIQPDAVYPAIPNNLTFDPTLSNISTNFQTPPAAVLPTTIPNMPLPSVANLPANLPIPNNFTYPPPTSTTSPAPSPAPFTPNVDDNNYDFSTPSNMYTPGGLDDASDPLTPIPATPDAPPTPGLFSPSEDIISQAPPVYFSSLFFIFFFVLHF
eukprot:TRINITY_DN5445_c0_g1_i2.p1 TRINITY_DN5445_c0_g1~~TRINITY_DN5445_c0_g1_i2.p1  ORF type:complete len:324 (-),score=63.39 TRINITY_DN5445_c0_g1_i2:33-977(-)